MFSETVFLAMSQEHEHNKVSLSVHRRWMRRNMILDGSIVGKLQHVIYSSHLIMIM